MKVFTPDDLVPAASDKYLGVLVSAKYARELNALPLERSPYGAEQTHHDGPRGYFVRPAGVSPGS